MHEGSTKMAGGNKICDITMSSCSMACCHIGETLPTISIGAILITLEHS
jgi:hypothetical protein